MSDQASPRYYLLNRSFFTYLEKLPIAVYSVAVVLTLLGYLALAIPSCFKRCRCDNGFVCRRLLDISKYLSCATFPNLFSKVNVFEKDGLDIEIREEILFLRTPVKSTKMLHRFLFIFGNLGLTVWILVVMAFLRYTPIAVDSECSTTSSIFGYGTQLCYCNSHDHSDDLPVDCKHYEKEPQICWNNASNSNNDTIEPDLSLTCYALSLEIGKSAAVALGILKISTTSIFIVFSIVNKVWPKIENCYSSDSDENAETGKCLRRLHVSCVGNERRCRKCIKIIIIISFSIVCSLIFYISGSIVVLSSLYPENYGIGEKIYKYSLASICFYLGSFIIIGIPMYAIWLEKPNNRDQYLMIASKVESGTLYDAEKELQVGINHQHHRSGANLVASEQIPLLISNTETAET